MKTVMITIREEQYAWCKYRCLNISALVRRIIDNEMNVCNDVNGECNDGSREECESRI